MQRVVRRLGAALEATGQAIVPVAWDERRRAIGALAPVGSDDSGDDVGTAPHRDAAWLLVPEIPIDAVMAGVDPIAVGQAYGLPVAVFVHDLIPIKLAAFYDPATVDLFRRYARALAHADLAIVASRTVRVDLQAFLESEGLRPPPIALCPLSGEWVGRPRGRDAASPAPGTGPLRLVQIATFERRKNHPRLLRALAAARRRTPRPIHLALVGRRGADAAYDAEVDALRAGLPDVTLHESLADAALVALMAGQHASLYASTEEGFGLPILEALWCGLPCLCHDASAPAEVAAGGGCLVVDMRDEAQIAAAVVRLASEPGLHEALAGAAAARRLRSWADVATDVAAALAARTPAARVRTAATGVSTRRHEAVKMS